MRTAIGRVLTIAALTLGWGLCPGGVAAATVTADIVEPSPTNFQGWTFKPATLSVNVGDVVTWANLGQTAHTVTADAAAVDSGSIAAGASFSFTFTKPGTFSYRCSFHPWMKGVVQVVGASTAAAPTPAPIVPAPTRIGATPTPAPLRITPAPPTSTAEPATVTPSPLATASPTLAATSTSTPATATTEIPPATPPPSTPTTLPATPTAPSTVTPISTAVVGLAAQPSPIAPLTESTPSPGGASPLIEVVVALLLVTGLGSAVVARQRASKG